MRNCRLFILVFFAVLIVGSGYPQKSKGNKVKPNGWTGTIVQKQTYSWQGGNWERTITVAFINAIPTLYRDDDSEPPYTDDKGTGMVTIHEVVTPPIVLRTETWDCSTSGASELHEVVVAEWDNTYSIQADGPPCTSGNKTVEDLTISISGQKLTDPNVLAGSLSESGTDAVGGTYSRTITWSLFRGKPGGVELIVEPTCLTSTVKNCTYDTWLPEPGRGELLKGSVMNIALKLQAVGGGPPTKKAKSFTLKLSNTSSEKGITINFPLSPEVDQLPDLRFLLPNQPESIKADQTATVQSGDGKTGSVKIASYDGGGWTTLTAEALLDDDKTVIQGHLLVSGGETQISVPKRDTGSAIASSWLNANGDPGEKDDKEILPGNSNPGDGLTAYEEYRGVISEGKFQRLDPQKKELGVRMKMDNFKRFDPLFLQGLDLFESATGIKPIRFDETEIAPDRRLNNNAGHANDYKQFVESLENGSLPGDVAGENQPTNVIAKLPAQSEHVVIAVAKIKQMYQRQKAALLAAVRAGQTNMQMPYTEEENIANTVAHELAHGINVNHHGLPSAESDRTVPLKGVGVDIYHIFDEMGGDITEQFRGKPLSGIGTPRNDESGELSCIMAYTSLYNWASRVGIDGSLNFYKVPLLPVGKKMCRKKSPADSSSINWNNKYFGDAAQDFGNYKFGDCMSQMKLRD